jgi:NAD(P)-dependent dehydrogenase (short-subunit alcohol dehydrogenase family)
MFGGISMINGARPVALVTGASSGIGKSIVELYAAHGLAVVLTDVNEEPGELLAEELRRKGSKAIFVRSDVSVPADSEHAVNEAMRAFGRLDCAVNNAGIGGEMNPLADYSIDGWNQVLGINLSGVFYGMKYQIPAMLKGGGGAIVNVSSILGAVGFAGAPAYTAAKHGLVGLTKAAALDYAAQGVRINVVGPAFISTPMIADFENDPEQNAAVVALHPIGRLGQPREVAELVYWLTSTKSTFVTGSYYPVDGGYLAR